MKFFTAAGLVALVSTAQSAAVHEDKRINTPLSIELTSTGNTAVKAVLKNTGTETLNLLKDGTILDDKPVEKVQVFNANGQVGFEGIRVSLLDSALTQENFVTLAAGESKEIDIEVAALHDLTEGGSFDVTSIGAFPYAEVDSTTLTGSAFPFFSNKLTISVDGAEAASVEKAINLAKRSTVSSDCTGTKLTAVKKALTNCASLAKAAATAANTNTAKVTEYFKTTANKATIIARLNAVAAECAGTTSKTQSHCVDTYSACSSGVLAYTLPSANYVVNCALYFSALPALTSSCHAQDQATTTLHEFTHASGVYSPGTLDNGYGYSAATALSASKALNNADSYALFANAIYSGC